MKNENISVVDRKRNVSASLSADNFRIVIFGNSVAIRAEKFDFVGFQISRTHNSDAPMEVEESIEIRTTVDELKKLKEAIDALLKAKNKK